jgi:hypothetical protein
MGFLRRLFGLDRTSPAPSVRGTMTVNVHGFDDRLAVVRVGGVHVDASVWEGYQRDTQDWSNGVRLMDPETGDWLRDDEHYPPDLRAAGARSIACVGLGFHPGSQSPAFAAGSIVRLVSEPTNPVNPHAVAVRSADGRELAGYVSDDELERVRALVPPASVGLVVWENYRWRPRERTGMRLVIGPSVQLDLVPVGREPAERAHRDATYAAGKERQRLALEAERAQADVAKLAVREAKRREREMLEAARAGARAERARLERERRAAGVCLACGGPIEPHVGKGRPSIRCATCRALT